MSFLKIFSSRKKGDGASPGLPGLAMAEEDFRGLIFSIEDKELKPRLPELSQKRVLEVSPRQKSFASVLKEKGAQMVVRVGGTKEKDLPAENFVVSHWESLPFLEGSTDVIVLRTSLLRGSLGRLIREASRILVPQGTVLLSDVHPFSTITQKDHLKNPVAEEGLAPGFERYSKWFRDAGLRMDWVKEIFFEGGLKKFLPAAAQQSFETLRRTPFMIFFSLRKE